LITETIYLRNFTSAQVRKIEPALTADSTVPSPGEWNVGVHIVPLRGPICCRMTIHATGARDHLGHLAEDGTRARRAILNRRKYGWVIQGLAEAR
jgi:hypothetical protein